MVYQIFANYSNFISLPVEPEANMAFLIFGSLCIIISQTTVINLQEKHSDLKYSTINFNFNASLNRIFYINIQL